MSVLNLRNLDEDLMIEVKAAALRRGVTLRAFVCEVLAAAVGVSPAGGGTVPGKVRRSAPKPARVVEVMNTATAIPPKTINAPGEVPRLSGRHDHDPKTCRVYRCGACLTAGHKDARRGLG